MEWRHEVNLKRYIEYVGDWSDKVAEAQRANARGITAVLRRIYERELALFEKVESGEVVVNGRKPLEAEALDELFTSVDNFEFLANEMTGSTEPTDYAELTWEELLLDYTEALYDLGDAVVGENEKFMFLK